MHIQLDHEYKQLCHIQSIKPGRLNICAIFICILLTLLTVGIPLLLYWKWQRFKNLIHLLVFNEQKQDFSDVSHYLIVDSYKHKGKSRNIAYRTKIITPYLTQKQKDHRDLGLNQAPLEQQICKYIEHKHLRYVIRNNILYSAKFKLNKNLQDYMSKGLSTDQINQSIKTYGKAQTFEINFFHVLRKMVHQKHLRFVFMMFAVKKILFGFMSPYHDVNQNNQKIVSITILAEILLIWLMMLGMSIYGAKQHNKIHEKIENQTFYQVIRNGQQIEVKLNELYVGDVVVPKKGETIYFKGILAVSYDLRGYSPYVIVNEALFNRKDNSVKKIPIESNLIQVEESNTIYPGSLILNMDLKKESAQIPVESSKLQSQSKLARKQFQQKKAETRLKDSSVITDAKFFIIVSDNNYIQKFYSGFKESCYFDNFQSIRSSYDFQQLIFQFIFLVLALSGTIFVSIDQKTHEHWINLLLSNIVLCFPFNLGLFCNFSEILSIIRLKNKQISVVNPVIQEIGIANNLSMQLSTFETLQFRGFIKRQRCTGLPDPEGYDGKTNFFQTYRKTKQQSIYAFLGWTGIYNLPYFKSQPLYKQIFDKLDFQQKERDEYDEDENINPRVINTQQAAIRIDWQEIKRFGISDMLVESVVIKNFRSDRLDKQFFAISQGEYNSLDCFLYFDQLIDEPGTDIFKDVMQRLHAQGKKIKYICIKKMLQNEKGQDLPHFARNYVQSKSQFGGLLVFDQWPAQNNIKNLIQLDTVSLDNFESGLNITLFSIRQQNALIGYDHILRKANIFHSMDAITRAEETYMAKADYEGVIHVGNGILDQGALLLSDVSANKISQSYGQADFQIKQPHQILNLLYEGVWALHNTTLTIICLVLFNFSKIVGQLVLFEGDTVEQLQPSPLSANYDKLFLLDLGALILPLFLLNLYQPTQKLVRKHKESFFRIELMFHVFISVIGLIVLYTIQFLDHGFRGTCKIYESSFTPKHFLSLRSASHVSQMEEHVHTCEGIVNFITVSFALLVIVLVDRQSPQRKSRNIVVGMINKLYMLLLWIGSIIYFHIPTKNIARATIVILIMVVFVFLSQLITKNKPAVQNDQYQQEKSQSSSEKEAENEQQRARRRMNENISSS